MLSLPTVGSGIFVGLLGMAQFAKIHTIVYFIIVQIAVGIFEVSCVCIFFYFMLPSCMLFVHDC